MICLHLVTNVNFVTTQTKLPFKTFLTKVVQFGSVMIWSHLVIKGRFGSTHYAMKNVNQSKFCLSLITAGEISEIDCNDHGFYGVTSSRI